MSRSLTRGLALLLSAVVMVLMSTSAATTANAAPRTAQDVEPVPVTGTLADGTGSVDGTFDVERFANQGGTLMAIGEFTGTITEADGTQTTGSQNVALPVDLAQSGGSCEILHLVLEGLDLNLLGLEVHLDTVDLLIEAVPGAGNLLGNLLCAVASLLDGPTGLNAILDQIATLLNQLLGILG